MESELLKVDKLQNIEQWSLWKFQLKVILKANELFDIVSGLEKAPPEVKGDENKTLKFFNKADSKAQKIIVMTLGQQPMLHILSCNTAHEMWSKLESVYEQKSKTSIHLIQQRFYSFEKEPVDNIATHISKLKQIVQQLKDLGENVSDTMIITKILMTLPSDFSYFYSAWESTAADEQTLDNLTARLMMEESRINSMPLHQSSDAFMAKKGQVGSKFNTFAKKQKGKCFLCKQKGHWKNNGPSKVQHTTLDNNNKKIQRRGDAFVSTAEKSSISDNDDDWYLDSGASDHMTKNRDWLTNYKEYDNPVSVRIGNGDTIFAYGQGDINILSFDEVVWNPKHLSNVLYIPDIQLNLFASNRALDKGLQLVSDNKKCKLLKGDHVVAVGVRHSKLFKMLFRVETIVSSTLSSINSAITVEPLKVWHERLCHQNIAQVKMCLKAKQIPTNN